MPQHFGLRAEIGGEQGVLEEITLRNLTLGDSVCDLKVRRHDGEVSVEPLRRSGKVQVSVVSSD